MKRLAVAAAIALAVSTVGVGPAAAESMTTTETLAAQAGGEAPGDGVADPGDTDAGEGTDPGDAADPGDGTAEADPEANQDGSPDGGGATEPSEPTAPGDEAADPAGNEDQADEDGTEDTQAIDASFSLEKTEMTADEIGDPDKGIRYTIDSLKAGDVVTAEPGEAGSTTVEADGPFSGSILGNTELKTGDTLDVSVTVAREGEESKTFSGSVTVIAPEGEDGEGDLTVAPKTQSLDDFAVDGVRITLANCVMDEEVNFRLTRQGDPDTTLWEDTQRAAGEDAAGFTTFVPGTGLDGWVGDFVVEASCGDKSAETTFTVTDGDGEEAAGDLSVTPKTQKLADFLEDGVNITLVNCHVDSDVKFRVSTTNDPDTTIWEESQKAGEDAAGSIQFMPQGEGGVGWVDEFLVMASCGDKSAETTFTVTEDGSVVDPKLAIDPENLSGEDFINRDKGVTITVTDCEPGSEVQFEVWGFEPSEKLYEQTAEANENGAASVQVYGLDDNPGAYVGTYTVMANCMDQALDGEFVVTGSGDGGGSGGSDGSDDSGNAGSMPRTGAELTGLGAGALLILGGAVSIFIARRRAQAGQ